MITESEGSLATEAREIDHIVQELYTKLYGGGNDRTFVARKSDEPFLQITNWEVRNAIQSIKNEKAASMDWRRNVEAINNTSEKSHQQHGRTSTDPRRLPSQKEFPCQRRAVRKISETIIPYRFFQQSQSASWTSYVKDCNDKSNRKKQDGIEAGFRPGKSTVGRIHVPTKTREYNFSLYSEKPSILSITRPSRGLWKPPQYTIQ